MKNCSKKTSLSKDRTQTVFLCMVSKRNVTMLGSIWMIRVDQTTTCKLRLLLCANRLAAERLRSLDFSETFNRKGTTATQSEKTLTLRTSNSKSWKKRDSAIKLRLNVWEKLLARKKERILTRTNALKPLITSFLNCKNVLRNSQKFQK